MIMKLKDKKGFTLAELLIVVAIIAVLVGISIPVFTAQLEKAKEGKDLANLRAAYAECSVKVLDGNKGYYKAVELSQKDKFDRVEEPKIGNKDLSGSYSDTVYVTVTKDGVVDVVADVPQSGFTNVDE